MGVPWRAAADSWNGSARTALPLPCLRCPLSFAFTNAQLHPTPLTVLYMRYRAAMGANTMVRLAFLGTVIPFTLSSGEMGAPQALRGVEHEVYSTYPGHLVSCTQVS